ncbi:MAG TPA: hypothetical protein VGW34_00570 [Allosphingosinicella sp.]|nr:hypothetical protein [Allosphingosinicella sp.]
MAERRKKRRFFTRERRQAYLAGLRRTGNHAAAAREAGIGAAAARRYRRRKPNYEAECVAAEAEAQRRLAGAEGPLEGTKEGAFESIRRGADGRLKIQAQGSRRWSKKAEDIFFDVLRECGNISAAARAAGVTRRTVWLRRRQWPAFARRFDETMEEAEIVLEYRVACLGTNWSEAAEEAESGTVTGNCPHLASESGTVTSNWPQPFDPELAMRFLKWRADKKRGAAGPIAALPPAEAVRERILAKVAAVRRHEALRAKRRAEEEE